MEKPLPTPIDYNKIADAMSFYANRGYKPIEVPWLVSKEAMDVTTPEGAQLFETYRGCAVASAEQSFIEMMINGALEPGKYVTASPCFRDDEHDELHHTWFYKVELIDARKEVSTYEVLADAEAFYNRYVPTIQEHTLIGVDLTHNGVELGSYGHRSLGNVNWAYGTGVAEPRLSYVMQNKGYHLRDIPKEPYGTSGKIYEEVMEFVDATEQHNPVMALTELSDLVGGVTGYLETIHPGITLEDLLTMQQATKRAFVSGRRT